MSDNISFKDQNKETQFLEYEDGNHIPYLKKDPKYFFRKIIALFGETETGKSVIMREILYLLKDKIPNVIVFAPTNDSNNLYTDQVAKPCIFKRVSMEILEEINLRQQKCMKIYSIANEMENMRSIFLKVADSRLKAIINGVEKEAARHLQIASNMNTDPGVRKAEEKKIKDMRDKALRSTYKLCIRANEKQLLKDPSLTDAQKVAVKYCDHNPDILLIFDDCASFFMKHKNEELIRDMFYMPRHNGITSIMSFQGDKDIPPPLRRASHVSFFTTPACAMAYASCKDNGLDRQLRKKIEKSIMRIFKPDGDMPSFRKLVYMRNDIEKIQVTLAESYDDFKMGGLWTRKFLEAIEPKSLSSGNNKELMKEIL
jgi:hypothetical protein